MKRFTIYSNRGIEIVKGEVRDGCAWVLWRADFPVPPYPVGTIENALKTSAICDRIVWDTSQETLCDNKTKTIPTPPPEEKSLCDLLTGGD